jgi:O-antigen ligase
VYFVWEILRSKRVRLQSSIREILLHWWVFFGIALLSAVLLSFRGAGGLSWMQYIKNTVALFGWMAFLSTFVRFAGMLQESERSWLINVYVAGVICSCVFEMAEVSLAALSGFDLVWFVFEPISYQGRFYQVEEKTLYEWAGFFRANGFAGTNTQGIYVATIVPLLLERLMAKKSWRHYVLLVIALVGIFLTMSRSAIVATIVGIFVIGVRYPKRWPVIGALLVLIALPLYFIGSRAAEDIGKIAQSRSNVDASRVEMYRDALWRFRENPAGLGWGQYYVEFVDSGSESMDQNPHNSWLRVLVELGAIGLLQQIIMYGFLTCRLARNRSVLASSSLAAMFGLFAAACFNEVLNEFYAFLFIILFSTCALQQSDSERLRRGASRVALPGINRKQVVYADAPKVRPLLN